MSIPILVTKLYIPPPRSKLVLRSRLIECLDKGLNGKLTLVCAPAGFGKTTLVSEWVAVCQRPVAWLSLDERDSVPAQFLAYLIAALQTVIPQVGETLLPALSAPQPPPVDFILTTLLNQIAAFPDPFVVVLDDYHALDAPSVDSALALLLDYLPPQMHLVISTREEPALPLARMRTRGLLTELGVADLRFTLDESIEFLNHIMGLNLSKANIAALETHTEGWIAGLQLATLVLQDAISTHGQQATPNFIESFTGKHHFVLDYLVEEVLQQQPQAVQLFLLSTSILDRLSAPLCDALLHDQSGCAQDTLEYLDRANLFIIALDNERHWYRYHHLFADVLRTRLSKKYPDQVAPLLQRASMWYEQHDLLFDAIQYALAAEDFERAAGLLELAWATVHNSVQSTLWLDWVKSLPDSFLTKRPVLSVAYAWALLGVGAFEASEAWLQAAEQWLPSTHMPEEEPPQLKIPLSEMVVVDDDQFRALPVLIGIARAYHAQALGDVPGTLTQAQLVLDLVQEQDSFQRGQAMTLLGLAYWSSGELELAQSYFADFIAHMRRAGNIPEIIGVTFVLADINIALGRLREAYAIYQASLQLIKKQPEPALSGLADLHRGMSELHRQWNNLEVATHHLQQSKALAEQDTMLNLHYRLYVAEAYMRQINGDFDGALSLLDQAEQVYMQTPLPDLRPLAALKARIWIIQGRLSDAVGWLHTQKLSIDDQLSYLREFDHITFVRLLIAKYSLNRDDTVFDQSMRLIKRLLAASEAGNRTASMIELRILQALAYEVQGATTKARMALEQALTLAEPEGYMRLFLDQGQALAELLRKTAKQVDISEYVSRLQAAFDQLTSRTPAMHLLPEPLSKRELEVLRLLATELDGPEIAATLIVSLNTLRTHTRHIYSKLGVNNRRMAVRRAEQLDLL